MGSLMSIEFNGMIIWRITSLVPSDLPSKNPKRKKIWTRPEKDKTNWFWHPIWLSSFGFCFSSLFGGEFWKNEHFIFDKKTMENTARTLLCVQDGIVKNYN